MTIASLPAIMQDSLSDTAAEAKKLDHISETQTDILEKEILILQQTTYPDIIFLSILNMKFVEVFILPEPCRSVLMLI